MDSSSTQLKDVESKLQKSLDECKALNSKIVLLDEKNAATDQSVSFNCVPSCSIGECVSCQVPGDERTDNFDVVT